MKIVTNPKAGHKIPPPPQKKCKYNFIIIPRGILEPSIIAFWDSNSLGGRSTKMDFVISRKNMHNRRASIKALRYLCRINIKHIFMLTHRHLNDLAET